MDGFCYVDQLELDGQFSAAFDTAALDHCATCFCRYTSTKAVCTSAVTSVWLVCSLWHICSILLQFSYFFKDYPFCFIS